MTVFRVVAVLAVVSLPAVSRPLGAQRPVPAGIHTGTASRTNLVQTPLNRGQSANVASDSVPDREYLAFLLGGALIGGVVGGTLAASYGCGEPQQYVTCSSTDPATGVVIGAGIGLLVGWLAWVMTKPLRH